MRQKLVQNPRKTLILATSPKIDNLHCTAEKRSITPFPEFSPQSRCLSEQPETPNTSETNSGMGPAAVLVRIKQKISELLSVAMERSV